MLAHRRALLTAALVTTLGACALPPPGPIETTHVVAPGNVTPEATVPEPPFAVLTVPGRPAVEGAVGTFSWDGFASDAPWLPGAGPVLVKPDIVAHVRLPAGLEVDEWHAVYAPLDGQTVTIEAGVEQSNGPTAEIDFPAPPSGTWSVRLEVRFVGHGRVNYYWRFETGA